MKKVIFSALIVAASLAACSPSPLIPATGQVNGVIEVDIDNNIKLSVSAKTKERMLLPPSPIMAAEVKGLTSSGGVYKVSVQQCAAIAPQTGAVVAGITLDATGSMSSNDRDEQRNRAAKAFVSRMRPNDQAFVASFNSIIGFQAWSSFTSDKTELATAIDKATAANGDTPLWDAAIKTANSMKDQNGNKVVLLLTDGGDNASSKKLADAIAAAKAVSARFYTVGLGSGINEAELQQLATESQGLYANAADANELADAFDGVFNASLGANCLKLNFSPKPAAKTRFAGTLSFVINGVTLKDDFKAYVP
jgi:Ca-activated chloride channel homolog